MNSIIAHLASSLARGWWLMLLRAMAAIAFGVLTFVWPGISLASLVLVFGAYCMADGIFTVDGGFRLERSRVLVAAALGRSAGNRRRRADHVCTGRNGTRTALLYRGVGDCHGRP